MWNIGFDRRIDPVGGAAALREGSGDARDITRPLGCRRARIGAAVRRDLGRLTVGCRANPLVVAMRRGDDALAVDRHRQHEAFVVVGVVAHEVDATRSAKAASDHCSRCS